MRDMNLLPELCSPNPTPHSTRSTLASSSISIVSNSYLLREAITLVLQSHQPTYLIKSYVGDINIASTAIKLSNHLVLIDSGIGENATITHIQEWRSLQPSPYVVVLELKNDIELILDCIQAVPTATLYKVHLVLRLFKSLSKCIKELLNVRQKSLPNSLIG
jgi:DNA-binding NarL/FixJ family response regulator